MTPEQAQKLRAPFASEQVGKLPKPTKKDNPKGRCNECGGWHGLPAVHLDYVGHAAVTDRLLQVDPDWSWEPMAVGPNGEPLFTNGGLWIKLTVAGVTRPGFGDETGGKGTKEVIGDAIRNAAMRFGVALDLWTKEQLAQSDGVAEPEPAPAEPEQPKFQAPAGAKDKEKDDKEKRRRQMWATWREKGIPDEILKSHIKDVYGIESTNDLTPEQHKELIKWIKAQDDIPF